MNHGMLSANKMMGTMIGRRRQMQDLREGKATAVLMPSLTVVKPQIKYVAFSYIGENKATGERETDDLVARLRMRQGSCVLGPFTEMDELWDARRGAGFKLGGIGDGEVRTMLKLWKRLYVYMFYPAEACDRVVWTCNAAHNCSWNKFVMCQREHDPRRRMWFYLKPLDVEAGRVTVETLPMDYTRALLTGDGGTQVRVREVLPEEIYRPTWVVMTARRRSDISQQELEALAEAARSKRLFATDATRAVLGDAKETCVRLLARGVDGGMDERMLHGLDRLERAMVQAEVVLTHAGGATVSDVAEAMGGVRLALGEYGWAMELSGVAREHIERAKEVWNAIKCLEARAGRAGDAGFSGGTGSAGGTGFSGGTGGRADAGFAGDAGFSGGTGRGRADSPGTLRRVLFGERLRGFPDALADAGGGRVDAEDGGREGLLEDRP